MTTETSTQLDSFLSLLTSPSFLSPPIEQQTLTSPLHNLSFPEQHPLLPTSLSLSTPEQLIIKNELGNSIATEALDLNPSPITLPSTFGKEEPAFHLPSSIYPSGNGLDFLGIRGFGSLAAGQIASINSSLNRIHPTPSETKNNTEGGLLQSILPSFLQIKTNPIKKMRRNRRSKHQKKPETTVSTIWKEVQKLQETQALPSLNNNMNNNSNNIENNNTSINGINNINFNNTISLLDEKPPKRQRIEVDLLSEELGDPQVPNNSPIYLEEPKAIDFSHLEFPEGDPFSPTDDWINEMFGDTFETPPPYIQPPD